MRFSSLLMGLLAATSSVEAAEKRPMRVDDLFRLQRVSDPQLSPDGKWVAYVVGTPNLESNSVSTSLWLAAADGTQPPKRLTNAPGKKDRRPRWHPDGRRILFESNRSGEMQLWMIDVSGGEARQLTTISTDATNGIWSPDGTKIAFSSNIYPEYSEKPFKESDALNRKRNEDIEKNPVKARTFTRLFYRHWDSLVEDKRQHLFVVSFDGTTTGEPKDVTPGDRDSYPTSDTFSTGENFAFSPDGTHLIFTAVPEKDEAWSTNYDLCRVPVSGGGVKWECLTAGNRAADSGVIFSPDGKYMAYRAQKKPGYEADRWLLMVVPCRPDGSFTAEARSLTEDIDASVQEFLWQDSQQLVFSVELRGNTEVRVRNLANGETKTLAAKGSNSSLNLSSTGKVLAYTQASVRHPAEVMIQPLEPAEARNLSRVNTTILEEIDRAVPESVTLPGADGTPMQMWILKPPGFVATKKWPVVYLVHGGPQSAWEDGWSFRWNAQVWAAQGYVVALPNPRGSTGFGQKYVDEITGDWGGKCYQDLMKGVDYLEQLPYVDKDRIASAGASFGGYMMNWFAVNTGRFKTLITHCSVWNFDSMYGTTDEIWFDENDHGGPPWGKNRESYEKHSPQRHSGNLGKFRTPMLIIHNDLDFRCPIGQGHELFTALQRQGVPSRFVNFPDEGHWVLKPRNSQHWHNEVFAWLKKHVEPGGK